MKIRGTALHIADKYAQLARDAQVAGNRVQGESLLQHAEHYYRIVAAAQAQNPQPPSRNDDDGANDQERRGNGQGRERYQDDQPAFGLSDPQPHINGGNGGGPNGAFGETEPTDEDAPNEDAREKPEGSGGRQRRRRPYRDRSAEPSAEAADDGAPQPASASAQADKGEEVASSAGED